MKRRLCIMLQLMLVATALTAAVSSPDMKFKRLDTREGLSNSMVNSIVRDSRGYVWLGTGYGLNRYDGYRVRTFFSYDKDTTTLRNNRIDEIQEGYGGRLWLKQGMNYSVYDPVTEKVDRNPTRWLNQQGMLLLLQPRPRRILSTSPSATAPGSSRRSSASVPMPRAARA